MESGNAANATRRRERLAALRDAAARKRKAPAEDGTRRIRVTRDARGDEQLELCGAPAEGASSVVMMAWERPYMEALVDALEVTPADTVLEIGYGLGFSCAAIQRRRPRRHVVVECDAGRAGAHSRTASRSSRGDVGSAPPQRRRRERQLSHP